jgi:23S rRNA-/tRNA-specific pseudouridylate synthase
MSNPEWHIGEEAEGVRLDKYLADQARLGSRGRAVAALERGKVYVNDAEAALVDAGRRLVRGDVVRVWVDRPGSAKRRPRTGPAGDLDVIYDDEWLIVVNKPAGLLTVPLERKPEVPSVYDQIERRFRSYGKRRPLVVHRIDQDTSGLVVFARDADAQCALKDQFKRREPARVYWAVVYGAPDPPEGSWRDVLVWDERALIQKETHPRDPRGTEAVSKYKVLESFPGDRGEPAHGTAQSDSDPGPAPRPHARGGGPLHLWPRRATSDRLWPSSVARATTDVPAPGRRARAGFGGAPAGRFPRSADSAAATRVSYSLVRRD